MSAPNCYTVSLVEPDGSASTLRRETAMRLTAELTTYAILAIVTAYAAAVTIGIL